MDNITSDFNNSLHQMLNVIRTHPNRAGIFSMFKKGPPTSQGFMWCSETDAYWTETESNGLKFVRDMVLQNGWDSSGYATMMRNLQFEVNKLQHPPTLS